MNTSVTLWCKLCAQRTGCPNLHRPETNGAKRTLCLNKVISKVIYIINCLLYLISTFLCFVFRRKRKGKGAKGRARSGGRAQKGSKQQGKAALPSPTTCSALTTLPITEENQAEQSKQADEPDGLPPSTNGGTEDTRKSSAGLKKIES